MTRLLLLLSLGAAAPAAASTWSVEAAADALAPGSAVSRLRGRGRTDCATISGQTGGPCTAGLTNYGSFGGRAGLFYHAGRDRLGVSLGALSGGPNRDTLVFRTLPPSSAGRLDIDTRATFFRLLAEGSRAIPLHGPWSVSLGAGVGPALANESTTCSASGALARDCSGIDGSVNAFWTTWEVTPAILYGSWALGFRYVGACREDQPPWNTFGVTLGWRAP